jgi:hypothetical protein
MGGWKNATQANPDDSGIVGTAIFDFSQDLPKVNMR